MKKTKKLLAFLLTIAMLTMMVPIVAMAENDMPDILTLDIRGLPFSIDKETDLFPPHHSSC